MEARGAGVGPPPEVPTPPSRGAGGPSRYRRGPSGSLPRISDPNWEGRTVMRRREILLRDAGVCNYCALDTVNLEAMFAAAERSLRRRWRRSQRNVPTQRRSHVPKWMVIGEKIRRGFNPEGAMWAADHIVPVWEGGGGCGLEGLQTLCVPCHKTKSAVEGRRRASLRRKEKRRSAAVEWTAGTEKREEERRQRDIAETMAEEIGDKIKAGEANRSRAWVDGTF